MISALEQRLDQAMPGWRAVAAEERWGRWISAINPATGQVRSGQFVDAVQQGDARYVIATLQRYLQEKRENWPIREPGQSQPRPEKPYYTRAQIRENFRQHQRGAYAGREADWEALQRDMLLAPLEGRAESIGLMKNLTDMK
jgi:hypothetical protein